MSNKPTTYVALLRGINVGGKTIVNMAELKQCFEKSGYKSVKTYINSGNVIFKTSTYNRHNLESEIEKSIESKFKMPIIAMVRSLKDMENLISLIPKSWQINTDQKCNVIFLHRTIDNPKLLKDLQPKQGIEVIRYHPGALFWSAKTGDLTKSNMPRVNRMGIYQQMTVRNLNTTHKLYELMKEVNS